MTSAASDATAPVRQFRNVLACALATVWLDKPSRRPTLTPLAEKYERDWRAGASFEFEERADVIAALETAAALYEESGDYNIAATLIAEQDQLKEWNSAVQQNAAHERLSRRSPSAEPKDGANGERKSSRKRGISSLHVRGTLMRFIAKTRSTVGQAEGLQAKRARRGSRDGLVLASIAL
jgi:hypothetical protein